MVKNSLFIGASFFAISSLFAHSAVAMYEDSREGTGISLRATVLEPLPHPSHSILGLDELDRRGLTGAGQVIGVIEAARQSHVPPGLEGQILNNIEVSRDDKERSEHMSTVSQVVASQVPGVGFAPGAKLVQATDQSKTEGVILVDTADAIKWVIGRRATAINLSIRNQPRKKIHRHDNGTGKIAYEDMEGIRYALKRGVPVFFAAGNDQEDIGRDIFLQSIWEQVKDCNPHLFFFVGGYEYCEPVFERDEIRFAKTSAFAQGTKGPSRHFVTGPFQVEAEHFVSVEERKKRLGGFRLRFDAFELKEIWIRELKEALERLSDQDLEAVIYPLLSQLEESFVSFFDDEKNYKNYIWVLDKLEEKGKGTPLKDELEKTKLRFLTLAQAHLDDTKSVEASELAKIKRPEGYDPREVKVCFEEDILAIDLATGKPKEVVFEEQSVNGTSFASPAVASVYLRLHQFADQVNADKETPLLTPDDIAVCMKAAAYLPPTKDQEKFGCGVVDGGAALALCERMVEARSAAEGRFEDALEMWEDVFQFLGQHLLPQYFFEVLQGLKLQDMFGYEDSRDRAWNICKGLLDYYPTFFDSHAAERLNVVSLLLEGKYEECKRALGEMFDSSLREENVDSAFEAYLLYQPQVSWVYGHFSPSYHQFETWFDSFLTCEREEVKEGTDEEGDIVIGRNLFLKQKSKLSLDTREGRSLLDHLLQEIQEGFERFDTFDEGERWQFLWDLDRLKGKLEHVDLSEDIAEQVSEFSEKASQLEEEREETS